MYKIKPYVVVGRLNLHVRAFPAPAIELRRIWAHRRIQLVRAESGDSNDLELGTELDECPFLHKTISTGGYDV